MIINMVKLDDKPFSMKMFLRIVPISNIKGMLQDPVLSKEKLRLLSKNYFITRILRREGK